MSCSISVSNDYVECSVCGRIYPKFKVSDETHAMIKKHGNMGNTMEDVIIKALKCLDKVEKER